MSLDLLREHFGDEIAEDAFEPGSALIGKGAWEDDEDEVDENAPHPEWEPFEAEDEVEEEPPASDPPPAPLPRGARPIVDRGERLVARITKGMDGFNTIEIGEPFELSV